MKSSDLAARYIAQHVSPRTKAPEGKANNARYRGLKFSHYGTVIAEMVDDARGRRVVLVHPGHFSSGTSKVQGEVRHAAKEAGLPLFEAEPGASHETNRDAFITRAKDALQSVENARIPDGWRRNAQRHLDDARAYAAAFGIPFTYDGPDPSAVLSRRERAALETPQA